MVSRVDSKTIKLSVLRFMIASFLRKLVYRFRNSGDVRRFLAVVSLAWGSGKVIHI